jgi:hypothetical protein
LNGLRSLADSATEEYGESGVRLPRFARNDETTAGQHNKRMLLNNLRLKELVGYDVL